MYVTTTFDVFDPIKIMPMLTIQSCSKREATRQFESERAGDTKIATVTVIYI